RPRGVSHRQTLPVRPRANPGRPEAQAGREHIADAVGGLDFGSISRDSPRMRGGAGLRGTVALAGVAVVLAAGAAIAVRTAPAQAAVGDFTVTPTTLNFPDTYVGGTASLVVTIKNISATSQTPEFAGGAPLDGTNFGGTQNCGGKTFAPGDTCQFTYDFH